MPRVPCRKFTLADIMILVAASAAGLALTRYVLPTQSNPWWIAYPMGAGTPLMAVGTVAMLGLRLRRPRPTARRLFRQPGAAASLAGAVALLAWAILNGIGAMRNLNDALDSVAYAGVSVGPAVAGAWVVLLANRTGRCERGWIDRSGIALGVAWIALMLVALSAALLR